MSRRCHDRNVDKLIRKPGTLDVASRAAGGRAEIGAKMNVRGRKGVGVAKHALGEEGVVPDEPAITSYVQVLGADMYRKMI